ncbi:MAG: baseplate J/gp47 family protein [Carboxydocellales bacterium]
MARPTFVPVYEETETLIKDRVVARIPDSWRKEPGDFIHDAVAATPLEVKELQINQDDILRNGFAQYAEGEYLDLRLSEVGLTRAAATPNKRTLHVTADAGVVVPKDYTASVVILDNDGNPLEYTVDAVVNFVVTGTLDVNITCATAGVAGNVQNGSQFIFLPPIPGISAIVDGGTTTLGTDQETSEAAYDRYMFKVQNPDTGGNKNDYVRWAQGIAGVGKAKSIPKWNGNGTVKVVLVGADYKPAVAGTVSNVQAYLDPGVNGLGEGKAPCGAQVTVMTATNVGITIVATVVWAVGADPVAGKTAFEAAVTKYLKDLVFTAAPSVVYTKIGGLLSVTDGVVSYSVLTVNAGAVDVPVGAEAVATLTGVTLN